MARLIFCLASITASIYLAAYQPPMPERPKPMYWPWEVQAGTSFMGFNSQDSAGPNGAATFSPKSPRITPSIRFSLDFIQIPVGSILLSAGYRLGDDVPLKYQYQSGTNVYRNDTVADLKHSGQFQFGVLAIFNTNNIFKYGLGLDTRYDWMKAPSRVGTKTEEKAWRPWIRINARYSFEIGANITPFIGIETAYALSKPKVDPSSHYRDYTINTGDFFLGIPSGPANSTESFTKGHFPAWEAGLTAGIRFGRRPLSTAKLAQEIELTADVQIDAEIDEEETEQNVDEGVEFEPEEEEAPIAIESLSPADRIKYEGFKSLLIHFDDNSMELTNETKTIIDNWVKEIWNGAYYSKVFDLGRLRIIANCDAQNETTPQQLSEGRARALAVYLWDKFRINISKVFGYGINKPIAENSTAEASAKNRYAQLLLDENDSRNADYKNIIKAEDGTFYIK